MTRKVLLAFLTFVCAHLMVAQAVSFNEDTALNAKEAEVLFKFADRVRSKLPHQYMQEDIFLVRWLRARNFNIDAAEEMLLKHLKWREDNRIDEISEENFDDMKIDLPYDEAGVDKEGRPLVQILLRDWNVRGTVVSGRRARANRWITKFFEDSTKLIRKFQSEGKNVTQFTLVVDAEGFNAVVQGCPLCMTIYLTIGSIYEEQYPGALDKVHVLNTPEMFRVMVRLVSPLLTGGTRKALTMHGTNREVWRRTLSETVDDSQLLPAFGGTLRGGVDSNAA